MARTLTSEQNLTRRRDEMLKEMKFLKRMRIIESSVAVICIVLGLVWRYAMGHGWSVLVLGAFLGFVAIGHAVRQGETSEETADTEALLEHKKKLAALLDEKLANDHYVLNDIRLKVGREKCWIDHLVVAPSGIFVIKNICWGGAVYGDTARQAHVWKIRGTDGKLRPARNPVGLALRSRRLLCNWLKGTNLIWERVFPVVAMSNPDVELHVQNTKDRYRVLKNDDLVNFINDFCFEKPILSNSEVEKLANGLNEQQEK